MLGELYDRGVRAWTLRNPAAAVRGRRSLSADRALAREVDWPRIALIVGLPKSGTTWFAQLVAEAPGYAVRPYRDPDGCTLQHDVCDDVFGSLPADLLSILKVHTRPTEENRAVIERRAQRVVVMHRDLRDVVVSRYFHVLADQAHRHHVLYESTSVDEGLRHSIEVVADDYGSWVRGWRVVCAADRERYLELRYEDLKADPAGRLGEALAHWGIELPAAQREEMVAAVAARTRFGLDERSFRRGNLARKGIVGDWRNQFTPEHDALFAQLAGELLFELGYERDSAWVRASVSRSRTRG
jgi:hypothetical protein